MAQAIALVTPPISCEYKTKSELFRVTRITSALHLIRGARPFRPSRTPADHLKSR